MAQPACPAHFAPSAHAAARPLPSSAKRSAPLERTFVKVIRRRRLDPDPVRPPGRCFPPWAHLCGYYYSATRQQAVRRARPDKAETSRLLGRYGGRALLGAGHYLRVVLGKFAAAVIGGQKHSFAVVGGGGRVLPAVVRKVPALVAAVPHLDPLRLPDKHHRQRASLLVLLGQIEKPGEVQLDRHAAREHLYLVVLDRLDKLRRAVLHGHQRAVALPAPGQRFKELQTIQATGTRAHCFCHSAMLLGFSTSPSLSLAGRTGNRPLFPLGNLLAVCSRFFTTL